MNENPHITRLGETHPDNLFQRLRRKAGLSQEEAAYRLHCPLRTLQRYEAGKAQPDYLTLRDMIDCYKCEAADLFPDLSLLDEKTGGGLG